jgi:hypothetical protein
MNARSLRPVSTLPRQPAFRFRLHDSVAWLDGQVEDLSEESVSFLTDLPLEIGTYLEVALPVPASDSLGAAPACCYVRVSRRVLDRWPDLRTQVTAEFVATPGTRFAGAA